MSVILTAGKKAIKPKSAKPKRKKQSAPPVAASGSKQTFDPTPPLSTPETTVWHWMLDGMPTTIMFNKADQSVWCNGCFLEPEVLFPGDGDDDGVTFEFRLEVKGGVEHQATIKRLAVAGKKDALAYQLFVDHYMILEHSSKQPVYPSPEALGAIADPPAYYEDPPSYDDVSTKKKN